MRYVLRAVYKEVSWLLYQHRVDTINQSTKCFKCWTQFYRLQLSFQDEKNRSTSFFSDNSKSSSTCLEPAVTWWAVRSEGDGFRGEEVEEVDVVGVDDDDDVNCSGDVVGADVGLLDGCKRPANWMASNLSWSLFCNCYLLGELALREERGDCPWSGAWEARPWSSGCCGSYREGWWRWSAAWPCLAMSCTLWGWREYGALKKEEGIETSWFTGWELFRTHL